MPTPKQKPMVKETFSDEKTAEYAQMFVIHTHAPWVLSTITGILGFYYTSMENPNLTGIMILPIFIYFNAIHFAKSYLDYNKTIVLTLMSLFPTMVIVVNVVPQYNPDIMGYLMLFYSVSILFCFLFVMSCGVLREKQLKERLLADKGLKQLTHHEEMFTAFLASSLAAANVAAMFIGSHYLTVFVLPTSFVPHDRKPQSAGFHIYVFVVVSVFGFLTLFFGKKTVCHFLKVCKLKAAKASVKKNELNV